MSSIILEAIGALERNKHIDKKVLIEALEAAMASAGRKAYGPQYDIACHFDETTGEFSAYAIKQVVEEVTDEFREISLKEARKLVDNVELEHEVEVPLPKVDFGRIAAQTAKQVVVQRVREAEREKVFEDFSGRVGDLLTAEVLRTDGRNVIVDVGGAEAVLPPKEQTFKEEYMPSDRIKVYVTDVRRTARGPQIVVSRTHPQLVVKLFELEVPEIAEGVVEIKAVAREAGVRTKMAVQSFDEKVDPVGACVGMKGIRVQSVVNEILGEKIDIIPWQADTASMIAASLSPAKISRVLIDESNKRAIVVVADDQLSLAIGKKGQNVRLASKLNGWKVDVKSEPQIAEEQLKFANEALGIKEGDKKEGAEAEGPLELPGLGPRIVEKLMDAGYKTNSSVIEATLEELTALDGIGDKTAEKVKAAAQEFADKRAAEAKAAAEAPAAEEAPAEGKTEETAEGDAKEEEKEKKEE